MTARGKVTVAETARFVALMDAMSGPRGRRVLVTDDALSGNSPPGPEDGPAPPGPADLARISLAEARRARRAAARLRGAR